MSRTAGRDSFLRRGIQNLAILIAALLIAMALAEVIFRTTHLFGARISWAQPDPVLGWKFVPNYEYWYDEENDHPITGRLNSFGWRDLERTLTKPQNSYRIAVLGDSFVEAFQVETDSTFLALIEKEFHQEENRTVELMNFGRMGMTQTEEFLVLQNEAVRFSPDMVVLFFTPENDIRDVSRKTAINDLRPYFEVSGDGELVLDTSFIDRRQYKLKTYIDPIKHRSALVSFLMEKYNLIRWEMRLSREHTSATSNIQIPGHLSLCTDRPDETYVQNYRLNKRLIGEMAEYCKDRNMEFLLVCINTLYGCEDGDKYIAINPTFDSGYFDSDLGALADSLDVYYLGLEEPFNNHCRETGESWYWDHWNYTGHRSVSAELTGKLKSII